MTEAIIAIENNDNIKENNIYGMDNIYLNHRIKTTEVLITRNIEESKGNY